VPPSNPIKRRWEGAMKTIEVRPKLNPGGVARVSHDRPQVPAGTVCPVADTTELRWFADGTLPLSVKSWFTCAGCRGALEERCDVYRLDDRVDVGVKLRSRETLELKIRRSVGERIQLTAGPDGLLEVWHKWSPAEELPPGGGPVPWVDVRKKILKRRFSVAGEEILVSIEGPPLASAGCDVEVVEVVVGDIEAWSLAFAAYGPTLTRRDSITACWSALRASGPCPDHCWRSFGTSSGYAEWLTRQ
jgi:hypothetical protein